MRGLPIGAFLLAVAAGCGGGNSNGPDAPPTGDDGGGGTDADPNAPDARELPDAAVATCIPKAGTNVTLAPVATGLDDPLLVTFAPGDARLFVIEQIGRIRVIKDGQLLDTPFLDLSGPAPTGQVKAGGEQGLLGLAFHPDFRNNDKFYVAYTGKNNDHVFAEFKAIPGTDTADPASRREILRFSDPYGNHNGGAIEFGPDGKLYIAIGDGGSGGDPQDRAQDDTSLFGKILRIDVDTRTDNLEYGIPADNPFATATDGKRREIWHKGLRNPFRFTFDRATGDIYIGDVGQGGQGYPQPYNLPLEEVNVSANTAGINWGWDDREGNRCFEPMPTPQNPNPCLTADRKDPVTVHTGNNWASVMGGQVYRGTCFPDLVGTYFYGDHIAQDLWAFKYSNGQAMNDREVLSNIGPITSIHEDATGELYVTTINGLVRRIIVP